jgi:formyl-CoA transferase
VGGVLAALLERATSGEGQHVEVNLLSSLLSALVNQASAYAATGTAPSRLGNAHPSIAPYELLRCADGPLAVACGNDGQFRRLVRCLGKESLADDERYRTNAARVAHRADLVADLEALLAVDTAGAWAERLLALGVPAGQVGSVADGFRLAADLGLAPLVPVGEGYVDQVRHPVTYSATPVTTYGPPPRLGEHDADVRDWLSKENSA